MSKPVITEVKNFDNVHRYVVRKQKNIHGVFCNLFSDLHLGKDAIGDVDIIFDDMDHEYLYSCAKDFEFHFFFTKDFVDFVVKTNMDYAKFNSVMKKHFSFFGE